MREMILAIRAIWDCWNDGTKLDFRGDFYTHTLMTPFFNPGPEPATATPKVFLAAVGELMTEVAGEVCDGLLVPRLHHRALPARGHAARARAGRSRRPAASLADFEISVPGVRRHRHDRGGDGQGATRASREQIAFYGSTPAYRGVLELHGWGDLQDELNALSKQGEWAEMGELHRRRHARRVRGRRRAREDGPGADPKRYGDIVDRVSFYAPVRQRPRALARRCWTGFKSAEPRPAAQMPAASSALEVATAAERALQLARRGLGQGARRHEHDVARRHADGLAHPVRRPRRAPVRARRPWSRPPRPRPPCPCRPSTPKAMTLPARTPSTVGDRPLDVLGEDVAAADDDHVLDAAAHDQLAVDEVGQVARAQPAVVERAGVGLGGRR